jgi:serine/threonine-protein kinase
MVSPGTTLQARYRVLRHIGGGGMGTVYQADDLRLPGRSCAIKEMTPAQLAPQDRNWAINAFRQEAQMLAGLRHRGLTAVTDFFAEAGCWYLVMDYVEGQTLEKRLEQTGGRFSTTEAREVMEQLFEVLEFLHAQSPPVVFRDLKPGNVMCTPQGKIKLIDFGIARFFKQGQTRDTIQLGTPGYAAPEQYGGMGQSDPRADVYSLGVLLLQMITGFDPATAVTPFPLPQPDSLMAGIPPHIAAVIRRATQLQPEARYPSVQEMRRALLTPSVGQNAPPPPTQQARTRAYPPTPPPSSPPPAERSSAGGRGKGLWIGLGIAALLLLVCGGGAFTAFSRGLIGPRTSTPTEPGSYTTDPTPTTPPTEESATEDPTGETPESSPDAPVTEEPDTPSPPPTTVPPRLTYVRGNVGSTDVYVADADGRQQSCVACRPCDEAEPAWAPDGTTIIFQSDCGGSYDLWTVRSPGGSPQRLTHSSGVDEREPDWSVAGTIVYRANPAGSGRNEDGELRTMRADGSGSQPLGIVGRSPTWSPDGSQITFMSERDGSWEIYVYDVASQNSRRVTSCSSNCRWPTWAPDGRAVIYHSTTGPTTVTADTLWITYLDGSTTQLTTGNHPGRPSWSTSGFIAFNSDNGIEIIPEQGGSRSVLIGGEENWAPIWSK